MSLTFCPLFDFFSSLFNVIVKHFEQPKVLYKFLFFFFFFLLLLLYDKMCFARTVICYLIILSHHNMTSAIGLALNIIGGCLNTVACT